MRREGIQYAPPDARGGEPPKEMSPDKLRQLLFEKKKDPSYLPPHKDFKKAFEETPSSFEGRKDTWTAYFYGFDETQKRIHEALTQEFISAMGDHFAQRVQEMGATPEHPLTILEVGAGDGRLTHFLDADLAKKAAGLYRIIATDTGVDSYHTDFPVENLDYQEALKKYRPDMVISSWMPPESQWDQDFRNTASVQEYILTGVHDLSGHGWNTWGDAHATGYRGETLDTSKPPAYEQEGFSKESLGEVEKYQICQEDKSRLTHEVSISNVCSFRREKAAA